MAFSDTIVKLFVTLLEVEIFLSAANSFIVELTFLAGKSKWHKKLHRINTKMS